MTSVCVAIPFSLDMQANCNAFSHPYTKVEKCK